MNEPRENGITAPPRARRSRIAGGCALLAILGIALALRLWYVIALPGQRGDLIFSDMWTYDYTGWQFVLGKPVTGEPGLNGYHPLSASTYYYVGYTYFVAAIYRIFGHNPAAIRIVQAVVGTLTVWVVYRLGVLCFGRRQALLAAAMTAVYLPLVYYSGLILTETWFIFLQMVSLTLWLGAWVAGPPSDEAGDERRTGAGAGLLLAFGAGLTGGMTCLVRTVFVIAVATLAAGGWCFPPAPASRRRRAALVASFLIGAGIVIAPITIRNYQIHGRFILVSTNGPSTFVTGHITHSSGLPDDFPPGTDDAVMSQRHRRRAFHYLAQHWDDYFAEIPEFFEIIWTDNDFWPSTSTYWVYNDPPQSNRADIQTHGGGSPPFGRSSYFPDLVRHVDRLVWCLIGLPMGLLAGLFLPREHRRWTILYLAVVPYLVIPFIAYAFSRYRLPVVPIVFILAAHSLTCCWDARRASRRGSSDGAGRLRLDG